MTDVDRAIQKTIGVEGGYVHDPDDPGGETKFGISKRAFPGVDIKNLTKEAAAAIYKKHYWDALKLDDVRHKRVRWKVFDIGVNMGVGRAARLFQAALGVTVDGAIGPMTIGKANEMEEPELMLAIIKQQVLRYAGIVRSNAVMIKYLKGWLNRAFETGDDL